jgi:hypothetical protein
MKRSVLLTAAALAIGSQLALADTPGPPPRGGPPIDEIATTLGLDDTQKAEVTRILDAAHARMEAARKENMAQVDTELATVLTAEQLGQFKKLMQQGRHRGPPPGPPPSSN